MAVVAFLYRYEHGTAGGAGECVEDQKILLVGVHHVLPARILVPVVERGLVEQLAEVRTAPIGHAESFRCSGGGSSAGGQNQAHAGANTDADCVRRRVTDRTARNRQ